MWGLPKAIGLRWRLKISAMITPELTKVTNLMGEITSKRDELESAIKTANAIHHDINQRWDEIKEIRLQEQTTIGKIMAAFEVDSPKVQDQLPFDGGIFELPYFQDNQVYFNPAVVEVEGERRLIIRRMRLDPNVQPPYNSFSELWWVALDDYRVASEMKQIKLPKGASNQEQWEDPRIFNLGRTGAEAANNKLWLTCTNFIQKKTYAHQAMAILDNDMELLGINHPVYGTNGRTITENSAHEKNWTWFMHDGKPHMIYAMTPHTVIETDATCTPTKEYKTQEINRLWRADLGTPRGGSNPVRVGDEYWCFFHSSQPWWNGRRRYFMGAYAFEAKPPFRITRMSSEPLLKGSNQDKRILEFPIVVFPGGAVFDEAKQEWFVVMGINDCQCGWQKIPHEALLSMTLPVKQEKTYEVDNQLVETPPENDNSSTTSPAVRDRDELTGVDSQPWSGGPDVQTLQKTGDADYPTDTGGRKPDEDDRASDVDLSAGQRPSLPGDIGTRIQSVPEQATQPRSAKPRTRRRSNDVRARKRKQSK